MGIMGVWDFGFSGFSKMRGSVFGRDLILSIVTYLGLPWGPPFMETTISPPPGKNMQLHNACPSLLLLLAYFVQRLVLLLPSANKQKLCCLIFLVRVNVIM